MDRRIRHAEVLSVGTELTTGATRDTNAGELAGDLTQAGVLVGRLTALPDRLATVTEAIRDGLERADLVVTTGGLGPTPDDLTREAIAAVCGERPRVDPDLERWLRDLFQRRGLPMPETNLKQAWLIPASTALRNANGTAPGWWVDRPDGRVIVALPGPPREMRPIWRDEVLPRLVARGLGEDRAWETLRLTGIGESALVVLIGEDLLRAENPEIATYSRPDAVDLRISAVAEGGRTAAAIVEEAVAELLPRLEDHVFARGDETWPAVLTRTLRGRTVAAAEIGTGGQVGALLGGQSWFRFAEVMAPDGHLAGSHRDLRRLARRVRRVGQADLGVAVRARPRAGDTGVTIAISGAGGTAQVSRTAFLAGDEGRRRAALVACAEVWRALRAEDRGGDRRV